MRIYLASGIQFPRRTFTKTFCSCVLNLNPCLFQRRAVDGSQKDGCQSGKTGNCHISYPRSLPGSRGEKGAKVPGTFSECILDACVLVLVLVFVFVCVCIWPTMTTSIKTMTKRDQSSLFLEGPFASSSIYHM